MIFRFQKYISALSPFLAMVVGGILLQLSFPEGLQAQINPDLGCTIQGTNPVTAGNTYTFSLVGGCTATSWTATCGSVQSSTSTSVTIFFNQTGCTSSTITALNAGVTKATLTITVTQPPTLVPGAISNPTQSINYNTTPTQISAAASTGGTGSYVYQWFSSPDNSVYTAITGATGQNYQPGALTATTYYKRLTTSGLQNLYTTNVGTVTVYGLLVTGTITPLTQSINFNTTPASMTATAPTGGSGTNTYQWQDSSASTGGVWVNVSGATSLTYAPAALTATTYYRIVSTSNGVSVNSAKATVTVFPQLVTGTITPSSQSINFNTTPASMTATATTGGNGTITYQWQDSSASTGGVWVNISGATSLTYAPGALTATTYYRIVSTSNGVSVNSAKATVTVFPQLVTGTISPSSQSINYNTSPASMTATAATGGNGTITYQWQDSSASTGGVWVNISGATSLTYAPGAVTATTYYRIVSTSNGVSVNSLKVTVTVFPQLVTGTITPSTQSINFNTTPASMTATAATGGNGTITYQWQDSSASTGGAWVNISGATGLTYAPGALTITTYYRIVSTSNGVSVNSLKVTVTVFPQLVTGMITPSTQSINFNTTPASMTATAATGGNGTTTYQWQDSSASTGGAWVNVSGATSLTYAPGALTATTYYRIVSTSNGVSVNSAKATITVFAQLVTGTITPSTQSINFNTTPASMTATAASGGNGTITYQWQDSSASTGGAWVNISGATSLTYTPGALTATTYYRIVSTSNSVSVNSVKATVTVFPQLVTGTITPSTQSINFNTTPAGMTATAATGGNGTITYQWQDSSASTGGAWVNISGATSLTYAPGALTITTYYRIVSTSNGVSVNSLKATVTVFPQLVTGTITPSTQSINFNTTPASMTATAATGGNGTTTYQWQDSSASTGGAWVNISGATSLTYTPGALTATTYYRIVSTSNGVSVNSAKATVTVFPQLVTGTISPSSQSINYNTTPASMTATAATGGNGTITYQCQDSSASTGGAWVNISGATSLTYAPGALTATTYYRIVSTSNGVSVNSAKATVTVFPQLIAGTISAGALSLPFGGDPGDITSNVATGGNGSYTYQWDTSVDNIHWIAVSGATALTYTIGNLYDTTYVRMQVTSNGAVANSNVLTFAVKSNSNTPGTDTLPAGSAGLIPMPAYPSGLTGDSLNYIRARVITKPGITDTVTADGLSSAYDAHQTTEYFDGLGRSVQVVDKQGNPAQADLISTAFYDPIGRVSQVYLPYTDTLSTGNFRGNASTKQPGFYNSYFTGTENYYYSNTIYEGSPLNRPLLQTPAGNSWTGSSRGAEFVYLCNTSADAVRIWTVTYGETDFPTTSATYAPGTLYMTQLTDENGHEIVEYKDLNGHMVMRKVQEAAAPSSGHDGWLCSYYVYDDVNNLRCVIPPKAVAVISGSGWNLSSVQNLCYQYAYDGRGRLILKKMPDAAPVYLVYNLKNLSVLTQDGNERSQNQWQVTKYDTLERPTQIGIYAAGSSITLDQMQTNVNNDQGFPETFTQNLLTYYDNYTQTTVPAFTSVDVAKLTSYTNSYPDPVTQCNQTRGLPTTTMIRVLEAPVTQWLVHVIYYDEKSRILQSIEDNITGGRDTVTSLYDFSGKALSSYERHNNAQSRLNPRTTVLNSIVYDHMGRLLSNSRIVNDNGITKTLYSETYDALGLLMKKSFGQNIENFNYSYNIRGWLTGINKDYLTGGSTHYFGMELNYDYGFGTPQFNGNIAGIKWKSAGNGIARAYGYLYDNVNRLVAGPYSQNDNGDGHTYAPDAKIDFSVPQISYDQNGNMLTMNQNGLLVTSSGGIDRLGYTYASNSNQLQSVTDTAQADSTYHLGDFQDGNTTGNDYSYDVNGNIGKDKNKNIDSIRYNYLNLPEYVHMKGKGSINYVYDASGNKYQRIITDSTNGGKQDTTTYIGPFVYHSDTLQFFNYEEGRIRYVNKVSQASGAHITGLIYDYFLKDHLGNTRMVLTEEQDTSIYAATMEDRFSSTEDSLFNNVNTTAVATPTGFEPTSGGDTSNHKVSRLNGGTGQNRVGPAIVLKVMARDTIGASVFGWYTGATQPPPTGETPLANDLLTALTNDVIGEGGAHLAGAFTPISVALTPALASFFSTDESPDYNTAQPKAFLNWVLFDEQLNFVQGGVTQVPLITAGMNKQTLQASIPTITKNGYIYIYVSNESQQDVFFDNLNIQYRRGPIVEEDHYYPFGLTMSGISSKALAFAKDTRYKFNKGSELEEKNFSDGTGLQWYDTHLRQLDPQLGRWWQIDSKPSYSVSPYSAMNNNPVLFNDFLGDTTWYYGEDGSSIGWAATQNTALVIINAGDQKTVKSELAKGALTNKEFDEKVNNFAKKGTTYDVPSFSKFYDDNGERIPAKTIQGESLAHATKITVDGKRVKHLHAEAIGNLIYKNGEVTAGDPGTSGDMGRAFPYDAPKPPAGTQSTGAHIHTHGYLDVWIIVTRASQTFPEEIRVYQGPSDPDLEGGFYPNPTIRNVVVDAQYIYLINHDSHETIKIPKNIQ